MQVKNSLLRLTGLFVCLFPGISHSQSSALDTSFNTDGIVTLSFGNTYAISSATAIQADGKILAVGYSGDGISFDFALARYLVNGSLDTSFDTDGKVTVNFGDSLNIATSAAIQSDGKILVAGFTADNDSTGDFVLVRFNTDGSLDSTFDGDGKVITDFDSTHNEAYSIAIQSDGKILVSGLWDNSFDRDFALIRYNNNGSLDSTFDQDGKLHTDLGGSVDYGRSVTIQQNDGKILVAGQKSDVSGNDFALVRYNSNGTLDNSFDTDGIVITTFGTYDSEGYWVAVQNDGKILVAGAQFSGTNNGDVALARYNSNGSLDNTFDADGQVTTDFGTNNIAIGYSIAIQNDGKIFVGGTSGNAAHPYFTLIRYNSNGSLDNTYDWDGIVTTALANNASVGTSLALQNDGKAVMGGLIANGPTLNFGLMRYDYNITSSAGIVESDFTNTINVYPNPAIDLVTVSVQEDLENTSYHLVNTSGEMILQKENLPGKTFTIDLSDQPTGIYFLIVKTDKGFFTQKIIRQ